jgi:hypothetical protein
MSELETTTRLLQRPQLALEQQPVSQTFLDFLAIHEAVQMAWQGIEQAMLDHSVKQLKGDWGTLSIVTDRKTWKADRELPLEYYNAPTLNSAKLNAMWKNDIPMPAGLDFTVTAPYMTRRLK